MQTANLRFPSVNVPTARINSPELASLKPGTLKVLTLAVMASDAQNEFRRTRSMPLHCCSLGTQQHLVKERDISTADTVGHLHAGEELYVNSHHGRHRCNYQLLPIPRRSSLSTLPAISKAAPSSLIRPASRARQTPRLQG